MLGLPLCACPNSAQRFCGVIVNDVAGGVFPGELAGDVVPFLVRLDEVPDDDTMGIIKLDKNPHLFARRLRELGCEVPEGWD
jgi:hypothetical protein